MKRFFFSILLLFVVFATNIYSQNPPPLGIDCPDGWTQGYKTGNFLNVINNNNCAYELYYCEVTYNICWDFDVYPIQLKYNRISSTLLVGVVCAYTIGTFHPNNIPPFCFSTCFKRKIL